jgi:hypothetical protein
MLLYSRFDRFNHPVKHGVIHARIDAEPEGTLGNQVGVGEAACYAVARAGLPHPVKTGVAHNVPREEAAALNPVLFDE